MAFRLLFISILSVVLTGCGDENSEEAIRFGISTEPVSLDPRYATDAVSTRINRLLYRRLVAFDEHYRFVPALADWDRLGPGHYRFHLRPERAPFHDGSRLTAGDVQATYASLLEGGNASPHRTSLEVIKRMRVLDEDTIDFYLRRPDSLFPGRLTIGILPAALIRGGHPFNRHPLGSGPLRFVSWQEDGNLLLQRVDDGRAIRFVTVKDPTVRVLKLLSGELDITQNELPPELVAWLRDREGVRVETARGDTFSYIGFNLRDPVTGDPRVRRAVALALDRRPIIHYLLRGAARPAGTLLPPEHWAGHDGLHGDGYAPDRARRLLRTAGYDDNHPLRLTFKTSTNPRSLRIATVFQQQLARVGIDLELRSYDWGTFYGDIKAGRFQMYSLSWVGLKMPDIYRYIFHSDSVPPAGANRGRLADAEVDRLIEMAENMADLRRKAAVYRQLQERLQALSPYVPLWYEDNILVIDNDLAGYRPATDGNYDGLVHIRYRQDHDRH